MAKSKKAAAHCEGAPAKAHKRRGGKRKGARKGKKGGKKGGRKSKK